PRRPDGGARHDDAQSGGRGRGRVMARTMLADADADIAALVYAPGERPDLVLRAFAQRVAQSGRKVSGLVQLRDRRESAHRGVIVLDSWQAVDFDEKPEGECRLDAGWLDRMGSEVDASIARGVDLAIVNRFGPLEADGRGFCNAIQTASHTETPLVIAV